MDQTQRLILLNPGPVNLSDRVRKALLGPDLCHREPEFTQLQSSIRKRLLNVYGLSPETYAPVLLTGSGTSAMEAMLTSLVPHGGKVLVIENGIYGERLSHIAGIYGIDHVRLSHDWGATIDLAALEDKLNDDRDITHVAVVHHETTTGRLNRLAPIADLCRRRGLYLLLDAVSSFGAEELDFDHWRIGAAAATANKCLHGVPGVSFVILRRDQLPATDSPKRSLYLDLETYCRLQDDDNTPFTQSVQTFYALDEALSELEDQGGWRARHQRYRQLVNQVRAGLTDLGMEPLLNQEDSSVVLNSFKLPQAIDYGSLHDQLRREGFVIYAGQGRFAMSIFRISTMGDITSENIERFIDAMGNVV